MVFNNNLLLGAAGQGGGYIIDQSIRFNDDDSAYLTRTPSGDGNLKTFTINLWIKISTINKDKFILEAFAGSGTGEFLVIASTNKIQFYGDSSGANCNVVTTRLFRDPNAWAMLTAAVDTTQATASNRIKLYYNGEQITSFSTASYPTLDKTFASLNKGSVAQHIGRYGAAGSGYYDGYMAEIHFIDGQALDPSSFGEVNSDTGQWVPIKYTGSATGNSFYLTGEDSADLGADYSGNGNDFTSSGLTSADQMQDSPTDNATASPVIGNQSTYNPIAGATLSSPAYSEGNTRVVNSSETGADNYRGTIGVSSGKWYVEFLITDVGAGENVGVGIVDSETPVKNPLGAGNSPIGFAANSYEMIPSGSKVNNGSASAYGSSYTNGDVMGIALDMDNGAIWFSKNGTWQASATQSEIEAGNTTNAAFTGLTGTKHFASGFSAGVSRSADVTMRPEKDWTGTCPSGFKALCTANLPNPTIALPENNFNTILYEGNGGGQRVGQFQPITELYTVPNSVIFNDDDSAYLTRTPGSASSHTTFTFSMWVKRCRTGSMRLFSTALGTSNKEDEIYFESGDRLQWQSYNGGVSYGFRLLSDAVYRDFSAWMHIVAVLDSTNGTAADRQRLYVNGERITAFAAEVQASASYASSINNTQAHYFSRYYASAVDLFDGYMAEIHFIDGQALGPDSFGQLDASTNRWIPKDASGLTFGTNGFYLDMETAPGTGSGAGTDSSGNGNNFTESGLAAADQVLDSPTKNFATLDPLALPSNTTFSDGNLVQTVSSAVGRTARATISIPEGKWVYEYTLVDTNDKNTLWGICREDTTPDELPGTSATSYAFYVANGNKRNNTAGGGDAYGTAVTTAGKTVQIAVHRNGNSLKIWAGHDQSGSFVWQASGDPAADTNEMFDIAINTYDVWLFAGGNDGNFAQTIGPVNFGQTGGFTYTPPDGFVALNTDNLPLTGGNISAFTWIKSRSSASYNHQLYDRVRDVTKVLSSNTTGAETTDVDGLQAFLLDGFQLGSSTSVNASGTTYVGWNWMTNTSGSGSTNTDGSITSTVLADTAAGFGILTYTGTGVAATIGHGLGITPKMVIVRERSPGGDDWYVYHEGLPSASYALNLNTTAAQSGPSAAYWNSTAPTSSVFSLGTSLGVNQNTATYVAYCFAEVEGFSKFGRYTGTNGGKPFIYTGFQPAFLLVKSTSSGRSWVLADNMRGAPYNPVSEYLIANTTAATGTTNSFDLLSNGFRVISGANQFFDIDASGQTFIYCAFAEFPFKYANAR